MTRVRLDFHRVQGDDGTYLAGVQVTDLATAMPIAGGAPREVAEWLAERGYTWCPGSNGIWHSNA